jgi:transcriptional regulator GlxA family with amidase domain
MPEESGAHALRWITVSRGRDKMEAEMRAGYRSGKERTPGFRLGIYVFKDAEIVDFAAPYGVFSVARRYDPELDAFLVADAMRPVQTQAGFTVLPNYSFSDAPAMDAFLIPGGFGTRQEMHNRRLHEFVRSLSETTLLTSVCTGSWVYGKMSLLDGLPATNRKEPDNLEKSPTGKVPIDRLAEIAPACKISRARVVDAGRIVTAGGITSGMEMGFHLLRRAGYDEEFILEVARTMEYKEAYETYRDDAEVAARGTSRSNRLRSQKF